MTFRIRPLSLTVATVTLFAAAASSQPRARGPNHPPQWADGVPNEESVDTDGYLTIELRAEDPDEEPLVYRVEQLPPGAVVHWNQEHMRRYDGAELVVHYPRIVWEPGESAGGMYNLRVTATDGQATITKDVRITVEEEWETFLMPGVAYTVYQPVASDQLGTYHGPSAEFMLAGWIHRNDNRGPSHVRIYAGIGLLTSTDSEAPKAVQPSFGFDLSIERNPRRSFLIPYFGLEGGVIAQRDLGAPGYVLPFVGAHLWSGQNLFVNASGGYLFPMHNVDEARGYAGKASLNFSLW